MNKAIRKPDRVVIYVKDIEKIMGKKETAARMIYHAIKLYFKKQKHQVVTTVEFCSFTGIPEELVHESMLH